jgi:16S rRNA processing protein RimM
VTPDPQGDFLTLARVVKTQGRRGEVAAEVHSDVPDRFAAGMKLFAPVLGVGAGSPGERVSAKRRELEIEDLWPHKGLLVLKFRGVDSISDAAVLIGSELQVPRSERAALEAGWTYVSDLVGCTVFDLSSGTSREIGTIEDVQFGAGEAPLLVVASAGKKFDVPFAEAYLEGVDTARREVRMKLPEGMLAINAPMTAEEKKQQKDAGKTQRNDEKLLIPRQTRRPQP